jgi:hypothetical protein
MNERSLQAYRGILNSKLRLDVQAASGRNVAELWNALRPLTEAENLFFSRFIALPFILEHRSDSWKIIKGSTKEQPGDRNWEGKLLSLFEIAKLLAGRPKKYTRVKQVNRQKWQPQGTVIHPAEPNLGDDFHFVEINGKPVAQLSMDDIKSFSTITAMLGDTALTINTSSKDFEEFGNIDFCFFKWVIAGQVSLARGAGGIAACKPKHFVDHRLYTDGFISFDDWISYLSTQTHGKALREVWDGFGDTRAEVKFDRATKTKTYTYQRGIARQTIEKRIPDEVFCAKDVFQGAALTVIQHIRFADPTGAFIHHALTNDFAYYVAKFMAMIWQLIEVKLPGTLNYYDYKISKEQATGKNVFTDHRKHEGGSWARR